MGYNFDKISEVPLGSLLDLDIKTGRYGKLVDLQRVTAKSVRVTLGQPRRDAVDSNLSFYMPADAEVRYFPPLQK